MLATGDDISILIVPGSLRASSYSVQLARRAAALAPAGVRVTVYGDLDLVEPFNEDDESLDGAPPGAAAFRASLRASDAVLVVTPEYNSSIPGQLKNALDWASRDDAGVGRLAENAIYGTTVMVASIATGQFGGVWAAAELRKVLKAMGARVVEGDGAEIALGGAATAFTDEGMLRSPAVEERLVAGVARLVDAALAVRSTARA